MKQLILGSWLGRLAGRARETATALRGLVTAPETTGAILNDQLAARLAARLARPGTTFVDVGAHIGSIVAAVAHHDKRVRIIAIEAMPDKAERLRRKFPRVEIHCCAAGAREGEARFFVNTRRSGYSSLNPATGDGIREIVVPLRRLDDLVRGGDVDVVKIDVEGAELGVLIGGEALIAASRPVIMFESGPEDTPAASKAELWRWFAARDYAVLTPDRVPHQGAGLDEAGFLDSHLYPFRTINYFAVPNEKRDEIRQRARKIG